MADAHTDWLIANTEAFDRLVRRQSKWIKSKHAKAMRDGSTAWWLRWCMQRAFQLGVEAERRRPKG